MKIPVGRGSAATSDILANPAFFVVLVIMIGGTMYLWRAGYMRPRASYILLLILVIALAALSWRLYSPAG